MPSSERGVEYETQTAEFTNGKSGEEAVREGKHDGRRTKRTGDLITGEPKHIGRGPTVVLRQWHRTDWGTMKVWTEEKKNHCDTCHIVCCIIMQ